MKVLDFGRAPLFLFLFQVHFRALQGIPIIIYRVSTVYLPYIYRVSTVFNKEEAKQIQNKNNKKMRIVCIYKKKAVTLCALNKIGN